MRFELPSCNSIVVSEILGSSLFCVLFIPRIVYSAWVTIYT